MFIEITRLTEKNRITESNKIMFEAIDPNNDLLLDANVDDNSAYGLSVAQTTTGGPVYDPGTLEADTFSLIPGYEATIISGNGNIDYGTGVYDTLDLSDFSTEQVVDYNPATATGGGTVLDVGDGARVFDYINLADGRQVVFEGVERIVFSDQTVDLTLDPDDPGFEDQWNLHMMGVQTAWDFTTGTEDVLIGVQDTGLGVDSTGNIHEDLQADGTWILSDNYTDDFFRDDGTGNGDLQPDSHGTSVQGIISAETNNGIGIAGINSNSDVYNIDVLDGNVGDLELASATQSMIDQATADGQKLVINMSLGGGGADPELEALIAANQDDVLFVIATGNGGDDLVADSLDYPAVYAQEYDNVIAVGASWGDTDELTGVPVTTGTIATYSNRGEGITLTGPTSVLTTYAGADGELSYNPNFNGTSAATPNVSGVASLVWSANSDLDAAQVKQVMSETAYDLGPEGYDLTYGAGFVNADAAVRRAIAI
jgi:serine protease